MSIFGSLGLDAPQRPEVGDRPIAMLSEGQAIARILEFTGYTIDDVISDPIARNVVRGYYGLYRYIERYCEEMDRPSVH